MIKTNALPKDLIGKRFGKLLVLSEETSARKTWKCICDCGNNYSANHYRLLSAKTLSCRHCKRKEICKIPRINLTGKKVGKLLVSNISKKLNRTNIWLCSCDCGNKTWQPTTLLTRNRIKSCGCLIAKFGSDHSNWNPKISEEERFYGRKLYPGIKKWVRSVKKRDQKCNICSSKDNLRAHHLEGWSSNITLRLEIENGITLCNSCHTNFHRQFSKPQQVTKQNFLKFKEEYKLD
jgi:hypothetical protein